MPSARTKQIEAWRDRVVSMLLRNRGPLPREAIRRRLGCTVSQVVHVLRSDLFEHTIDGWDVTQEGRTYWYGPSTSPQAEVVGDLELEDDYGSA
jgi:hypothetical protein